MKGLVPDKTLRQYGKNFEDRINKHPKKSLHQKIDVRLTFPLWGSSAANSQGDTPGGGGGYDRATE